MIIVECYLDKVLFSEIFGKVRHVEGKMEALRKIKNDRIYILDYDPYKPTEDLPKSLKEKLKLEIIHDDDKIRIYKSSEMDIFIILLKPDVEGFFRKFGGKIDTDTHTRNEKILKKIIENNREVVKKIKYYFVQSKNFLNIFKANYKKYNYHKNLSSFRIYLL